jgi:serine/threonine protein kinase
LIMELIPSHFKNLGLPPSLVTCTRDTFAEGTAFNIAEIIAIALSMADALRHLHENNVSHGDIYAHNTMIDEQANMLLGDFGAASDLSILSKSQRSAMQAIEIRAFGCLLDDLLPLCNDSKNTNQYNNLADITITCMQTDTLERPSFSVITKQLAALI